MFYTSFMEWIGFDKIHVAGVEGSGKWWDIWDNNAPTTVSANEPSLLNPSYLTADPQNNKIYIGAGHREWNNDWYRRSIVQVLDLNNNTVSIQKILQDTMQNLQDICLLAK